MIRLANLLPMMERWRQTSMELFTDATILPAGPTSISRRIEELQYHCSKEPVKKREKSKEKRLRNKYLDVFPLCLVIGRLSDENEFPTKKKNGRRARNEGGEITLIERVVRLRSPELIEFQMK